MNLLLGSMLILAPLCSPLLSSPLLCTLMDPSSAQIGSSLPLSSPAEVNYISAQTNSVLKTLLQAAPAGDYLSGWKKRHFTRVSRGMPWGRIFTGPTGSKVSMVSHELYPFTSLRVWIHGGPTKEVISRPDRPQANRQWEFFRGGICSCFREAL